MDCRHAISNWQTISKSIYVTKTADREEKRQGQINKSIKSNEWNIGDTCIIDHLRCFCCSFPSFVCALMMCVE